LALSTDRIAEKYCFIAEALILGWRSLCNAVGDVDWSISTF